MRPPCVWKVSPLPAADHPAERARQRDVLAASVREAGALALRTFQTPLKTWIKGHSSPVSEADIAVDILLRERLIGSASDYGWLSEETEDDPARLAANRIWIVDPIDGTRSYLAGRPDWVVSAALVEHGRPVLAAVFAPVSNELFLAAVGAGATRNGAPIMANAGADLGGAKVAGPKRLLDQLAEVQPPVIPMPRLGSLALRLTRVSQGEFDVAFAGGNSHDWDLAAADLLVHEAGGALTTLAGQSLTYNRPEPVHGALVAAGRGRHETLIGIVRDRPATVA
jgi:myo-inositol-1(or 4)-monophosphatase